MVGVDGDSVSKRGEIMAKWIWDNAGSQNKKGGTTFKSILETRKIFFLIQGYEVEIRQGSRKGVWNLYYRDKE